MDAVKLKLACIAVHAAEMLGPGGHEMDRQAILGLLADPAVKSYLEDPEMRVFLPLKRGAR